MKIAVTIAEICNPNAPFILQDRPYVESLRLAAAHGFDAIELQLADPKRLDKDAFFGCCDELGLQLVSIATGLARDEGMSLSSPDEAVRLKTVERIYSQIDLAAECGHQPGVMMGLLVGRKSDSPSHDIWRANLGDSLHRISDYGKKRGVAVTLEPVNHYDSDSLNTWREMTEFLDDFHCDHIKIGLDLYHMSCEETNILETIRRYGDRVGCVQLMDHNRQVPGRGNFNFDEIVETIKQTGYQGPIIMECLPLPDAETALDEAVQFFKKYFT